VRVDRDVLAEPEPLGALAQRVHRPDELVRGSQRELGEELAVVDVEVRAADPCLANADADLPGLRIRWRDDTDREAFRGIVDNGFHASPTANGSGDGARWTG